MRRIFRISAVLASGAALLLTPAAAIAGDTEYYELNVSRGTFPSDVKVSNVNGVQPLSEAYKNGYTLYGWTVDRCGDRGYVTLSPTRTAQGQVCENLLALPSAMVHPDEWLMWEARSVYRHFPESYRVELLEEGAAAPVVLCEVTGESHQWKKHVVSLSAYTGKIASIRFVATSSEGYMLALDDVETVGGFDSYIYVENLTGRSQGRVDDPVVTLRLTCLGAPAGLPGFTCTFEGEGFLPDGESASTGAFDMKSGETRLIHFPIPGKAGREVEYDVELTETAVPTRIEAGSADGEVTLNHFRRRMVVDKGTGMWCTNCTEAEAELDEVKDEFGDDVIMLNTHVRDVLANDGYWADLKWYAVPYMMLNRDRNTQGDGIRKFDEAYNAPTDFDVHLSEVAPYGDNMVEGKVTVRVAAPLDNSTKRYCSGFVLTADFHDPANNAFVQSNGCSFPSGEAFYFLPKAVAPDLMYYDDVTLTSVSAFGDDTDALPAMLQPGEEYTSTVMLSMPAHLAEFNIDRSRVRMVAFVIDTTTGQILNADALRAGEAPLPPSGIDAAEAEAGTVMRRVAERAVAISLAPGETYTLYACDLTSRVHILASGIASGTETVHLPDTLQGVYVLHLTTSAKSETLKMVLR